MEIKCPGTVDGLCTALHTQLAENVIDVPVLIPKSGSA
jgi:hypothetical protein